MNAFIQSSLAPIQSSLASLQKLVDTFGQRITSVEVTASENFEALSKAEKAILELRAMNTDGPHRRFGKSFQENKPPYYKCTIR